MSEETTERKKSKSMTSEEIHQVALTTKEQLELQTKREVRIRLEPGDKVNYETVQINGYTFIIKKGESVMVPEEVYNILVRASII